MERLTCESAEGQDHGGAGQQDIKDRRERRQTVKLCPKVFKYRATMRPGYEKQRMVKKYESGMYCNKKGNE